METLLNRWLSGRSRLSIRDQASVALARESVRAVGAKLGLPETVVESMAICASELCNNQLHHAGGGECAVEPIARGGVPGLAVIAADRGSGINDPTRAAGGGRAPGGGLGIGFSGVLRLADEVDLDTRGGEGTCVVARKFGGPVPAGKRVAVMGRPKSGERLSGDDAVVLRDGPTLWVGVADGLGHGEAAREASARAMELLPGLFGRPFPELFAGLNEGLVGTRGAVVAALRLDEGTGAFELACVGNIGARLFSRRASISFVSVPGVIGRSPSARPRVLVQRETLAPGDRLVLFSDGLTSRLDLDERPDLRGASLPETAHQLLLDYGQNTDDELVVVVQ